MSPTLTAAGIVAVVFGTAPEVALDVVATDVGEVLAATETGRTVYTFREDGPNRSTCYGACAEFWPPFEASLADVPQGDLGIIKRRDDTLQWALDGQPLYFWAGDRRRGDVTGDGVGGVWNAARPSPATTDTAPADEFS